jgi:hypothetical protein
MHEGFFWALVSTGLNKTSRGLDHVIKEKENNDDEVGDTRHWLAATMNWGIAFRVGGRPKRDAAQFLSSKLIATSRRARWPSRTGS